MEKESENLRITALAFIRLLQIRIIIITSRLQKQSIKPFRQYRTSFYIFSATLSTMPIPIMSLLIIWKFGIVLSHFERLRMLARAIKVPHLEERTFQIPYLNNNGYTKVREHYFLYPYQFIRLNTVFLTQRFVSNKGLLVRTALSLSLRSFSFEGFNASVTAFSSYSFMLQVNAKNK